MLRFCASPFSYHSKTSWSTIRKHTDLYLVNSKLTPGLAKKYTRSGPNQGLTFALPTDFLRCFLELWLACQKKSYLICDEITNVWIFTQPIPNFFFEVQNWDCQTGQTQLLKKLILHNISEIHNFVTYQIPNF